MVRISLEKPFWKVKWNLWRVGHRLLHYALWLWPWYCQWHKGDTPVSYDPAPDSSVAYAYCPECGCMLDTKDCLRCGMSFLDFSAQGFDDIMAAPCVTNSGDMTCVRCCTRSNEEEERDEAEYCDDFEDGPGVLEGA